MKLVSKPSVLTLVLALSAIATIGYGQSIQLSNGRSFNSPTMLIAMMEKKLGEQFGQQAEPMARTSTATLTSGQRVISYGSVVSGQDSRFSYLIFPADALHNENFQVRTSDGRSHQRVASTPIQVLSSDDNLAVMRIQPTNCLSANTSTPSSVGSFVGILTKDTEWKTATVTNSKRSAFTGVAAATEKALHKHWERIGLIVNNKRTGYPEVVETDLALHPREAGAPVFDRGGKWHGIAISRVDQHSTYVISSQRVMQLVQSFEQAHL